MNKETQAIVNMEASNSNKAIDVHCWRYPAYRSDGLHTSTYVTRPIRNPDIGRTIRNEVYGTVPSGHFSSREENIVHALTVSCSIRVENTPRTKPERIIRINIR